MIKTISSELVVPCEETPKNPIWLSNLDLAARRGHTATVYFYRPNNNTIHDFFAVESLKSSLEKVLVTFYPLAGLLGMDRNGRIEINCTGEGALFVVARTDAMLNDYDNFAPSTETRNLFVPQATQPDPPCILLMVQVTLFKCGGVVFGTALHHSIVDARCAFHFIETWTSIARGETSCIEQPFLDRTVLRARLNRKVMLDPLEYISDPKYVPSTISASYTSSIIKISRKHINALKLRCGDTTGARVSVFRAITALIWRCTCMARKLDTNSKSRLYTMIDMRNRMCPPLPSTYFGNAVIRTSVSAVIGDVISGPISHVARRLHGATNQDDDYARSLINYLETAYMGNLPRSGLPASDLRVISWIGLPVNNADFGLGEPILCAPALMYYSGYLCLMDSPGKDAGVTVVMSLEPESMPGFKELFFEELAAILHV
ncbi:HXXXD-type acyl-transferase family protein [Rhynchospora pubera]|uniref:HXXXD-type acyl-transferase family protein n=1 Tax=Rhynchospora pubera TaxID=906938 RepID=A0AAV8FR76_9POAL|nr:HXXXD-type acyl-transferase family protein [Rhynchospora pubera]